MNLPLNKKRLLSRALLVVGLLLWQGITCPPVTLKEKSLTVAWYVPGYIGRVGAKGACFSLGYIPPESFSPGPDEVPIGFDDYWDPGSQPFPCHSYRTVSYTLAVGFDLSQFDEIVGAMLYLETSATFVRSGGQTTGQNPPISCATTLGMGTASASFYSWPPADNETSLPATQFINVGVTSQVKDWLGNPPAHQNFGFVIWGPRGEPDRDNPWEDSDATVSMYKLNNTRLKILYKPANNPRVPP